MNRAWFSGEVTSRKQAIPLVPVQSRTGTHGGIRPGSWAQGAGRGLVGIGPGSYGTICPGSRHEPGLMGLALGPQPLVQVHGLNWDKWVSYIYPIGIAEHSTVLCFFWPARRGHLGALAHLLCTWGVRWNVWATLVNLSPLETRPPSSIFPEIYLGLAVCHVPSPSSPPSIARADLVASTTVVSLLFLSSF